VSGELIEVTPNKEKSKSMLAMAKTRIEMLEVSIQQNIQRLLLKDIMKP